MSIVSMVEIFIDKTGKSKLRPIRRDLNKRLMSLTSWRPWQADNDKSKTRLQPGIR